MKKKVLILLCVFSCCNLVGCNVDSELLFGSEAQQETEKATPETATEARACLKKIRNCLF